MHRHSRGERDIPDTFARGSVYQQSVVVARGRVDPLSLQRVPQARRIGGTDPDCATDARGQLLERRLDNKLAAIDDQDLVDDLCDLREDVA